MNTFEQMNTRDALLDVFGGYFYALTDNPCPVEFDNAEDHLTGIYATKLVAHSLHVRYAWLIGSVEERAPYLIVSNGLGEPYIKGIKLAKRRRDF